MRQTLYERGGIVIPADVHPLARYIYPLEGFCEREGFFDPVFTGDTGEEHTALVARVLSDDRERPVGEDIGFRAQAWINALASPEVKNWYGALEPSVGELQRLQFHVLPEGGFVGSHVDDDDEREYSLVGILHLGREYTGGQIVIENESGRHYRPQLGFGDLLVTRPTLTHWVEKVESGRRVTAVQFWGKEH